MIRTTLQKIQPFLRNILFRKKVLDSVIPMFLSQIKVDGNSFLKYHYFRNRPSDEDIRTFFEGLCKKVLNYFQHYSEETQKLEEILLQDIKAEDKILAAKVFATFYDDLYLIGMSYFFVKEPDGYWKPIINHNVGFLLNFPKIPEYQEYPNSIPYTAVCGELGEISFLKSDDFTFKKEYFFKVE